MVKVPLQTEENLKNRRIYVEELLMCGEGILGDIFAFLPLKSRLYWSN